MASPVRVVALDHFSAQDRDALVAAAGARFAWRVVPYWRFRDAANKVFPPAVGTGLETPADRRLEPERARYAAWARRELERIYLTWPFDVLVLPSDTYYYVRPLPDACHRLGIPVVVVQKETTITDYFFAEHAPDLLEHAPFIGDRMTVCSERHKRFWVEAGANAESIVVTGQPRFDLYASAPAKGGSAGRTILFLSYELDAYMLETGRDWSELRAETEGALFRAAESGARVVVKLHPLQDREAESEALAGVPGIELAEDDADTRRLILEADAVVGFQTTALYEAIAAGKPVAYAAWGDLYDELRHTLISFDERPDLLTPLSGPDELATWLTDPPAPDPARADARRTFVEEALGPLDGHAAERTLDVIAATASEWGPRRASSPRRRRLEPVERLAGPLLRGENRLRAGVWSGAARIPIQRLSRSASFRRDRTRALLSPP